MDIVKCNSTPDFFRNPEDSTSISKSWWKNCQNHQSGKWEVKSIDMIGRNHWCIGPSSLSVSFAAQPVQCGRIVIHSAYDLPEFVEYRFILTPRLVQDSIIVPLYWNVKKRSQEYHTSKRNKLDGFMDRCLGVFGFMDRCMGISLPKVLLYKFHCHKIF